MLYITLRQMEYVVSVARHRSLSGAAVELNVSQPSLSNALTQVESRLGCRLFRRRKGAPTTLTPEGELYAKEAEELLARARRLEDAGRFEKAITGRLTIGLFDDLAPFHLGPLLDALGQVLPDVELQYRDDYTSMPSHLQALTQRLVSLMASERGLRRLDFEYKVDFHHSFIPETFRQAFEDARHKIFASLSTNSSLEMIDIKGDVAEKIYFGEEISTLAKNVADRNRTWHAVCDFIKQQNTQTPIRGEDEQNRLIRAQHNDPTRQSLIRQQFVEAHAAAKRNPLNLLSLLELVKAVLVENKLSANDDFVAQLKQLVASTDDDNKDSNNSESCRRK